MIWGDKKNKNMKMNLNTEIKSMYLHILKKYFLDLKFESYNWPQNIIILFL